MCSGEYEAVIADLYWFRKWIPFCGVDLVHSSIICDGIIFETARNSDTLVNRLLVPVQCSDLNLKILVQFIDFWKTSVHRV